MKRLFLTLLLIISVIPAQALVIGTTSNYPPLSSSADNSNHFFGFEIDIMTAICQRIKQSCTFKPILSSAVLSELLAQSVDLAIAGIIIPSEKVDGYIFSLPYLVSNAQFITEKKSVINNPAAIKNKRVGVRHGTLMGGHMFGDIVTKIYQGQVTIVDFPTINDAFAALTNENIDVVFTNAVAADYWLANNGDFYKLVGPRISVGNGYGIMANQGQEPLIAQINQALLSIQADGTYATIYSRYFMN